MSKLCIKCDTIKSLEFFYKRKRSTLGVSDYCKECCKKYEKENYFRFKNRKSLQHKTWSSKNRNKINSRVRIWYHTVLKNDVHSILAKNLRRRLTRALQENWKTGSAVSDLGCSIKEFKLYLESQFLPGMSWDNYGEWHIDHVIPISLFDLSDETQTKEACNYLNLQPLWASDNIKKSNNV
jgi:hypothetical protein